MFHHSYMVSPNTRSHLQMIEGIKNVWNLWSFYSSYGMIKTIALQISKYLLVLHKPLVLHFKPLSRTIGQVKCSCPVIQQRTNGLTLFTLTIICNKIMGHSLITTNNIKQCVETSKWTITCHLSLLLNILLVDLLLNIYCFIFAAEYFAC